MSAEKKPANRPKSTSKGEGQKPSPSPPASREKTPDIKKYLLTGTIKYNGTYHQPGEILELDLEPSELAALQERGYITNPDAEKQGA